MAHLESAAGIAGVTKLLLQLQHQQLVPLIHADKLNPNINFNETPFYVPRELSEWKSLELNINGVHKAYPKRAGISAFGAGGANVHIIIEQAPEIIQKQAIQKPYYFGLSCLQRQTSHSYRK